MKDDFYSRAFIPNNDNENGEDPEKRAPRAPREPFMPNNDELIAKNRFSVAAGALFAFTLTAYAVTFFFELIVMLFFKESYELITSNTYYIWATDVVAMYLCAFPVFCIVTRKLPKSYRTGTKKMGIDEFVLLFFISEAVMLGGSMIGNTLNQTIGTLMGREVTNAVSELVLSSPLWLITLVVVIIGPIVEELIFRKLLIDKLSVFGDRAAILATAIAFGLFHGNLYQFFYAFGLGLVLGYMYTKTRNVIYPIVMHMIINFLGSVVAIPISEMTIELTDMMLAFESGGEMDFGRLMTIGTVIMGYALVQYAMAIAGVVIFIKKLQSRSIYVSDAAEIDIPKKRLLRVSTLNVGCILFFVASLVLIVLNLFV